MKITRSLTAPLKTSNRHEFFVGKKCDLKRLSITLTDIQSYATVLHQGKIAVSSIARMIAAIKSLFTFAHQKTGLLKANPAGAVTLPKVKDTLAERILPEWVVHSMIGLEPNKRNRALLKLLYIAGLRVSKVTQLQWFSL